MVVSVKSVWKSCLLPLLFPERTNPLPFDSLLSLRVHAFIEFATYVKVIILM